MAIEKVREHLKRLNIEDRIMEFPVSSATVELAAKAAGVIPARICKTLSFTGDKEDCILVATAGDAKVQNGKFKKQFGHKARMLKPEEVLTFTGHEIGGVCPFGIDNPKVRVYIDESIKRFDSVFPACGSSNSAVELGCEELFNIAGALAWVDVCKLPEEEK